MLVCKQWRVIIEEFTLYQTVCFYSKVSVEVFTKKVQDQPEIAKKVERLVIQLNRANDRSYINLTPLLLSLTNVQSFFLFCWHPNITVLKEGNHFPFHDSAKHLFLVANNLKFHRSILAQRSPNLETLFVKFEVVPIDLFQNAPFLTRLELQSYKVSFSRLETIHSALIHLRSLLISNSLFHDIDDGYNDNIMPATSLTTLELKLYYIQPDNLWTRTNILNYIRKKYPALSSLTYRSPANWTSHDPNIGGLNEIAWKPLLHQLGPQLKKIQVDYDGYIDQFFRELDDAGCQIKYLRIGSFPAKLFEEMMLPSNQLHFIQTLVLDIPTEFVVTCFDWLKQCAVLKKLKLCGPRKGTLDLYSILENCPPLLDTLSFEDVSVQIDPHHPNVYHQIKTLSLYESKLPYEFDAFILHCLPKLSKLKLKYCDLLSRTFDLKDMNLACFYFEDQFHLGKNNILVSTLCDDQKRWHSLIGEDFKKINIIDTKIGSCSPRELRVSVCPASTFKIRPELTLICHSVKKLKFSK
jgi:hypothetical protein